MRNDGLELPPQLHEMPHPSGSHSLSPSVFLSLFNFLSAKENTKNQSQASAQPCPGEELVHAPVPSSWRQSDACANLGARHTERLLCISLCPGMSTTRGFYFLKHSGCRHCDFELHFSFIRTSPFSLAAWLTSASHNGRQNTCFDVVCLPSVLAHRSQRFLHAETRDSSISFFRNSPLRSMIFLAAPGRTILLVPLLTDLDSSTRASCQPSVMTEPCHLALLPKVPQFLDDQNHFEACRSLQTWYVSFIRRMP